MHRLPQTGLLLAAALVLAAAAGLVGCPSESSGPTRVEAVLPPPDFAELERWATFLKPHGAETLWDEVQWRASMWDAVLEAHATDRPLLVWSMNGHPLGFT